MGEVSSLEKLKSTQSRLGVSIFRCSVVATNRVCTDTDSLITPAKFLGTKMLDDGVIITMLVMWLSISSLNRNMCYPGLASGVGVGDLFDLLEPKSESHNYWFYATSRCLTDAWTHTVSSGVSFHDWPQTFPFELFRRLCRSASSFLLLHFS